MSEELMEEERFDIGVMLFLKKQSTTSPHVLRTNQRYLKID